jgi:hypothetical protein
VKHVFPQASGCAPAPWAWSCITGATIRLSSSHLATTTSGSITTSRSGAAHCWGYNAWGQLGNSAYHRAARHASPSATSAFTR